MFARGLIAAAPFAETEFFRIFAVVAVLLALSRRFRGREEGVVAMCSFCWCLNNRSRRAKHLVHSGHSNGFSLVWDRSCLFRCSSRANDLWQVPHMCGLGLSVFGGGKMFAALGFRAES